jgi:hypothetical protein
LGKGLNAGACALCDVLVDVFHQFFSFLVIFLGVRGLLVLDSELRWFGLMFPGVAVGVWSSAFFAGVFVSALFQQTMAEGHPISDIMAQSFCSAEEFRAGWEGWLEGARSAQLRFDVEEVVCVGVLCAERNGFLVLAEEGDFPHTGPWHRNGWVVEFSWYYYFGRMVYMDPFDERFFNSSGFFSANLISKSCVAFDDQVGGYCCWLDAGKWWIFCWSFLLLEVPIIQSMEGFLGWVMGVVGD